MPKRSDYVEIVDPSDEKVTIVVKTKKSILDFIKESFDNYIKYNIILMSHDESQLLEHGVHLS